MENVKVFLNSWNSKTNERQKIQQVYLIIGVVGILVAGVVALINASLGHTIVLIALFALSAFLANAILWNLVNSAIVSHLAVRPRAKRK